MHQPRDVKQVDSKEIKPLEQFFYNLTQSFDLGGNVYREKLI